MSIRYQPLSQLQPAAAGGDRRLHFAGNNNREVARGEIPQPIVSATNMDAYIVNARGWAIRNATLLNSVRNARDWRRHLFQCVKLCAGGRNLRLSIFRKHSKFIVFRYERAARTCAV